MNILNTPRLILSTLEISDLEDIHAIRTNASVNQFLGRNNFPTLEETKDWLRNRIVDNQSGNTYFWSLRQLLFPRIIGTVCFWNMDKTNNITELGYELLPEFQGKGLMREALKEVIKFGFKNLELEAIHAVSHHENIKSIQVLEDLKFNEVDLENLTDDGCIRYTLDKMHYQQSQPF